MREKPEFRPADEPERHILPLSEQGEPNPELLKLLASLITQLQVQPQAVRHPEPDITWEPAEKPTERSYAVGQQVINHIDQQSAENPQRVAQHADSSPDDQAMARSEAAVKLAAVMARLAMKGYAITPLVVEDAPVRD